MTSKTSEEDGLEGKERWKKMVRFESEKGKEREKRKDRWMER